MRCLYAISVIILVFTLVGCGSVTKSIMAKQEWSENYAAAEGVVATSPLMIDGNWRTIGETVTPTDTPGNVQYTEAVVKLPEKKSIRKIVIHTPNIETLGVYVPDDDGQVWKKLWGTKNNQEKKLDINISAVTDQIKIKVRKTSEDQRSSRGRVNRAKGKIGEIEIYGLVEGQTEQIVEEIEEETEPVTLVVFDTPAQKTIAEKQPAASDTSTEIKTQKTTPTKKPETVKQIAKLSAPIKKKTAKPKTPPAAVGLKSPQTIYTLAEPIPVTIGLRIGADDIVTLEDLVRDETLRTKLAVKTASGEKIECAKKAPPLSRARPYRSSGRPVDVRNARTLEADSVITVEIANLLEYYPIKEPGTYAVQFNMQLAVHASFVGRYQTQINDLETSIRSILNDISLAQSAKAAVTKDMKEEIEQIKQKKGHRYIVVGTRGKMLELSSNVLELTIQ